MHDVARPVLRACGGAARRSVAVGAVGLLVAAGLSGCASGADPSGTGLSATALPDPADGVTNGVDDLSPVDALSAARTALLEAASYRVTGSPAESESLDLVFVAGTAPVGAEPPSRGDAADEPASARGSRGTVTRSDSTFSLRAVDGAVYVRGDLEWLADEVAQGATRTLGGKWLLLPDSLAQGLVTFTDPAVFADTLLDPEQDVAPVGASLVDGTPAVGVRYVDSEVTVWVSGVGPAYPLLVERLGATATDGVLRFTDIDEPVTLSAPKAENTVVVPGG